MFLASLASTVALAAFSPVDRPYDVESYAVTLSIDPSTNPTDFKAEVAIKLKTTRPTDEIELDRDELLIEEAKDGKTTLGIDNRDPKLIKIKFPKPLAANATTSFKIWYSGKVGTNNRGLFKVTDPDDASRGPLLFTHFEPLAARSFLPCNDQPFDKALTEIRVTVPQRYDVISNGKRVKDRKFAQGGKALREIHWKMDKPQSTYLISLAIAPFGKVVDGKKGLPITVWVGAQKTGRAKYAADVTRQTLDFIQDYVGVKYPWPKYDVVGLPTFIWGGMENTSATHMNEDSILLNSTDSAFEKRGTVALSAHEAAHQWFGDYVTMKWWDDLWLNESFASYVETQASQHVFKSPEAEINLVIGAWVGYFREEDGPRSHPIVDKQLTSADDAFDATNYTKGQNILRMLSNHIGEAKFKKALNIYLTRHALKVATYGDFFRAAEEASGEDLSKFRDSWLLQRGYPVITYGGNWNRVNSTYELRLNQRSNHVTDKSLFTFRLPVVFHRKAQPTYSKEMLVDMTTENAVKAISLPAEPEWITVNPRATVLAKVVPEHRDEAKLNFQAIHDPEPIARIWANFELAKGLLDNTRISSFAESTLNTAIESDPSPYVRIAVLGVTSRMKSRWVPQELGETILELARSVLAPDYSTRVETLTDRHGWSEFRSVVIGALGHVNSPEVMPIVVKLLENPKLMIDDLGSAARSMGAQGDAKGGEYLRKALALHGPRGHRYRMSLSLAFGSYQNVAAAQEIAEIVKTCGSDIAGRIGRGVVDNQILKNSSEWTNFLKDFVLTNHRFGDEVKVRLIHTIEEVKNKNAQVALEAIVTQSSSDRVKEVSRKILAKNFNRTI